MLIDLGTPPKGSLGGPPRTIREMHWWKPIGPSCQPRDVGGAEILNEGSEAPAISDGVMNGEDQQMIVGISTEDVDTIERTLDEIERLAERGLHQFLDSFGTSF